MKPRGTEECVLLIMVMVGFFVLLAYSHANDSDQHKRMDEKVNVRDSLYKCLSTEGCRLKSYYQEREKYHERHQQQESKSK